MKNLKMEEGCSGFCDEFFKVYLPDRSSQRMRMPPAFVKLFNGTMPNKAVLKDLSRKAWHVEMEIAENGVFFKDGWERFANDHSLELGNFLVFRYDGDSSFDVKIFRTNGCLKDEALGYKCISKGNSTVEKIAIPVSVKIEKEPEEEQTCPPTRNCKRKYTEVDMKRSEKCKGSHEVSQHKSRSNASMTFEQLGAFEASEFSFPTNPYFIASVCPGKPCRLTIPKKLVIEHGIKMEPEMLLRNENGKLWPVKVVYCSDGRVTFTKGWREFWNDNSLGFNDKCVFEFLFNRGRQLCKEIQVHFVRVKAK